MNGEFPVIFVAIGAVILIVGLILNRQAQARMLAREAALAGFASENGFEFSAAGLSSDHPGGFWAQLLQTQPSEEESFVGVFSKFEPFDEGDSPNVENLMVRRKGGADWYLFDYTYEITRTDGDSSSTTTYPHTVAVVRLPLALPALRMSRETLSTKLFGSADVQFESEEFNKRYFVQCEDKKSAFDILHPKVIDWLVSLPMMTWQMAGPFILIFVPEKTTVEGYRFLLSTLEQFVSQVPGYVQQDRGFQSPWTSPLDQMGK